MASPVLQADAQGHLLKQILLTNKSKLLGTLVGLQKGFSCCPILVYIAISDGGIIRREIDLAQVMKADAVVPAIKAWLKSCSVLKGLFSLSLEVKPGEWIMTKKEAEAVALFLVSQHTPRAVPIIEKSEKRSAAVATPARIEPIQEGQVCPECGQQKLVKKSVTRGASATRFFLACAGYPKTCKGIYPAPVENHVTPIATSQRTKVTSVSVETAHYAAGQACPRCKDGKLVERKAKTDFLGCSNYPKCKFTDYRD